MSKLKKKIISNIKLSKRINLNKKFQKFNFLIWQQKKYKIIFKKFNLKKNKIKILDLGCGTGIQIKIFTQYFKKPFVTAVDLSEKSILEAKKRFNRQNIKFYKIDIDRILNKIDDNFDIIHSSYAFYYSKNPKKLLKKCFDRLNKNGCIIISCPDRKHDMVNFINSIRRIDKKVLDTIKLYDNAIKPFSINNRKKIKKILFKKVNKISFKNFNDFINFWKNTTYYNVKIISKLKKIFPKKGFIFNKGTIIFSLKKK